MSSISQLETVTFASSCVPLASVLPLFWFARVPILAYNGSQYHFKRYLGGVVDESCLAEESLAMQHALMTVLSAE